MHIHDQVGVLLQIDYTPSTDEEGPTFHDIRILSADYQQVGPNLTHLFREIFVLGPADKDGIREAESFLSMLVGELHGQTKVTVS